MNPGLEFLEQCAAETGFRVAALEKVVRLGDVLADPGYLLRNSSDSGLFLAC
jgi:hypothetical protein